MTQLIHRRQKRQPSGPEIADVLHRLYVACASGHIDRPVGSSGRREFEDAMKQARETIQQVYHGRKEYLP